MYSKVLGPSPQGLMQSWFGAVGGLARIVAPILVTYLYTNFGPRWTFISVDSLVVLSMLLFMVTAKKLIPYHLYILKTNTMRLSSTSSIDTTDVVKDVNMNQKSHDEMSELNKPVKMRNTVVKYEQQYRTRPNSWSLVDRSSFYCSDTDFI